MYIQWKFKSFYKIKNICINIDFNKYNSTKKCTLFASNIAPFIFYLLFIKIITNKKIKINSVRKNNPPDGHLYIVSCFVLPIRKKKIIFLRAPYKNKLARLNILRREYTTIFSIKNNYTIFQNIFDASDIIINAMNFNFSTLKLKHVKTAILFDTCLSTNFIFNHYIKF